MKIDIISVLYRSEKWLKGYLDAIEKSEYPLADLNLILVDNDPSSGSEALINNHPLLSKLNSYQLIKNTTNTGFGVANNQGVKAGSSPYVFFLNIDTALTPSALAELKSVAEHSAPEVAAWELRQFPYEHPKVYHPVTQYVSWASAAALVVKREVFENTGWFDERIFMYAEDVDLSWSIRSAGYQIRYCPKSVVYHFTYADADEVKPTQFYYSIYNNLMLRYKYGSLTDILEGYRLIRSIKNSRNPVFPDQRKKLDEMLKGSVSRGLNFRSGRKKNNPGLFKPTFMGLDYELTRKGAFYVNKPWWEFPARPKVSVIVRTHKRPLVMEQALISLLHQTYPNIEVVVVEDGENTAQHIAEKYVDTGKVKYYHTGINKGRSYAGNLGMTKATGTYLCFLDDDDLVYADHIESIMAEMLRGNYHMVHAPAFCVKTEMISTNPYVYKEFGYETKHDYAGGKEELLNNNLFPIQAVLFEKKLFDELGGFDETIDYLEDWALWLKYAFGSEIGYIDKVTSLYRVPASSKQYKTRLSQLLSTRNYVLEKYAHNYKREQIELEIAIDHLKTLRQIKAGRVLSHIDLLIFGYDCISLNGWAVVDGKDNPDKIYLRISINNNTYHVKMIFDNRTDIQRKFGSDSRKLGFKADIPIPGIKGNIVPFSLLFVKGDEFYERHINWWSVHKIRVMSLIRKYLNYFL